MYYLGIDLGGMSIKAGVCNEDGVILHKDSCVTVREEDGDRIIRDMASLCLKVIADTGITVDDIAYAGIASPGSADSERGVIIYAATLPFLNCPIAARLSELTGIKKIYIDNDANAAAKGEATFGAAKGYRDSLFITIGTGVGGGIIIGGKIYTGFNFCGAELGHTVIEFNGRQCGCGRKGCFEAYSSATALINMTKEAMEAHKDSKMWEIAGGDIEKVDGKTAFDGMRADDEAAKGVINMYIEYLGCGLTNIVNTFQPEVLLIGGGICKEGENLTKPLYEIIKRDSYCVDEKQSTKLDICKLGNDAGIIGAAFLYSI